MKWVARLAIEVTFDAKDANEAGEVADTLAVPTSFAGHPIYARSAAWIACIEEPSEEQNQESKP